MDLTFYEMCTKEDIYLKNREDKNVGCALELPDFVVDSIRAQFKKLDVIRYFFKVFAKIFLFFFFRMIDKNPNNRPKACDLLSSCIDSKQLSSFSAIVKNASDTIIKLSTEEDINIEMNVRLFSGIKFNDNQV